VVATPIILSGSSASLADRIAEIGDVFAGSSLLLQWEGGPEFTIYGHSARRLPRLDLSGLRETSTTTPSLDPEIPGGAASSFSRRARKALNKPGPKIFIQIYAEQYQQIS
jgi:hypothetical protein